MVRWDTNRFVLSNSFQLLIRSWEESRLTG